ncbi:MAG: lasso peptide biosynthesis B2 protein [Pseudomonadales bacterium]|nr:lasso peptide biosynthesis B2 protein [Pseudomonadales bacterium]
MSLRDKVWLLLLYPYSGIVRAIILLIPFRKVAPYLGEHHQNIQFLTIASIQEQELAKRIGQIVEMASRYTPWQSKCLVQAIMARTLLWYYRVDYVMHLGAKMTKDVDEPMKAHAWLSVGSSVITGRAGHSSFGILTTYSSLKSEAACISKTL